MAPPSGNVSRPGRMLAVLVALIVVLLLAIVGSDLTSPGSWRSDFRVLLGLDLTSGTTVVLQAQAPPGHTVTQSEMATAKQIMFNRVNGAGFTEAQVEQQGSDLINVSVPGGNSQQVVALVSTTAQLLFRQVLLTAPNSASATTPVPAPTPSATTTPSATRSPSASASTSPSAKAAPTPSASASASAAALPGSAGAGAAQEMARQARALPAATASATPAASASPAAAATASPSPTASPAASAPATSTSGTTPWQQATGDATLVGAPVKALFNKLNCADPNWQKQVGYGAGQFNTASIQTVSCQKISGVWYKYALDKAKVTGPMITSATASLNQTNNTWEVFVNFNGTGTNRFGQLTTQMFDAYHGSQTVPMAQLAMVLDGTVISSPVIQAAITGGQAQITGSFTQSQADQLANQLSYGALPLTFIKQSIQTVTPQLGRDQLDAGLLAGALGLILVLIYLLVYYRGLAVVAASSLVIAAVLAYLSVVVLGKYAQLALSLSGIAGLIVAIGITADSFVVFFERLRDEVRDGRSLRAAVERGWTRARRTILVSDTVSFLAAALLYYFAIGNVKGFAFTLGLTTIIDVVVVFTFTKPMITLLARTKFYGGGHPLSGLDPARLGARAPWRGSPRRPAGSPARTSPARSDAARTSPSRTSPAKES